MPEFPNGFGVSGCSLRANSLAGVAVCPPPPGGHSWCLAVRGQVVVGPAAADMDGHEWWRSPRPHMPPPHKTPPPPIPPNTSTSLEFSSQTDFFIYNTLFEPWPSTIYLYYVAPLGGSNSHLPPWQGGGGVPFASRFRVNIYAGCSMRM